MLLCLIYYCASYDTVSHIILCLSYNTVPHILLCLIYYCVSHIIPCLSYTTLSHRILSLIQYFVSYNTVPHILLCPTCYCASHVLVSHIRLSLILLCLTCTIPRYATETESFEDLVPALKRVRDRLARIRVEVTPGRFQTALEQLVAWHDDR